MQFIVKNLFGLVQMLFSSLVFIYKSCRQVLTPINNSLLISKLPILDKFRLVTFHTFATQRHYKIRTGIHRFRRNECSRDLD
jgi:hypothetical protein